MKEKNTNSDYRKIFMDYYRISRLSSKYVIHHIDGNHENNDIDNLLLLPMKLHSKYHFICKRTDIDIYQITCSTRFDLKKSVVEDLFNVLRECAKWADYKKYLDGKYPNIHKIKLED